MSNKEGWNNVAMSKHKKRETGFTLLEMMICIFFVSIFFLLVPRLHSLFIEKPYSKQLNSWEWSVFTEQVQLEFREVQSGKSGVFGENVSMMFFQKSNGDIVAYEIVGNHVVRRVNGVGREIVLQKVQAISFELTPYTLSIQVEDISGKEYQGVVTRYAAMEMMT